MFTDGTHTFIADKTLADQTRFRTYSVRFGDGYRQTMPAGINSIDKDIVASFRTRPEEEINQITDYLDSTRGSLSFTFTMPDGQSLRVKCVEYDKIYEYDMYYSLTIMLERVYDE